MPGSEAVMGLPSATSRRRPSLSPNHLTPENIQYLQRTAGNHAVQRLLGRDRASLQRQPEGTQPAGEQAGPVEPVPVVHQNHTTVVQRVFSSKKLRELAGEPLKDWKLFGKTIRG